MIALKIYNRLACGWPTKPMPKKGRKAEEMELMTFSNKGIAGMNNFRSMDDVLRYVPFERRHTWCDGTNYEGIAVYAILSKGEESRLDMAGHYSDGNEYVPDTYQDAPMIGEQIAGQNVVALRFEYSHYGQCETEEWEEYLPIQRPDWKVIRRRVEDALRKNTDFATLFGIATKLGCKIY